MRRRTLVLATALALAAAPAAGAKEIDKAQVCGPSACASVDDDASRLVLLEGGPPGKPPAAAPYYDVRFQVDHGEDRETFGFVAVPSKRAYRTDDGEWWRLTDEMLAVIQKASVHKPPFPAVGLPGAAPPPDPKPQPAASDGSNLLWPEGVLLALVLAVGGVFLVRRWLPFRAAAQ
jgi:hypothetical protein